MTLNSQEKGDFALQRDIWKYFCVSQLVRSYWHLLGRSQEVLITLQHAGQPPANIFLAQDVNNAEVENPWSEPIMIHLISGAWHIPIQTKIRVLLGRMKGITEVEYKHYLFTHYFLVEANPFSITILTNNLFFLPRGLIHCPSFAIQRIK